MLRRLSLTLALSAGLFAGVHIAAVSVSDGTADAFSVVGNAHAQTKFTSRIKRVRIKKKRVGSGFKIAAVTEGASANGVAATEIAISDAITGELLDAFTLETAKRGALEFDFAETTTHANGDSVTIKVAAGFVAEDGSVEDTDSPSTVAVAVTALESGRLVGNGVGDNGWTVRLRVSKTGHLSGVLRHENKLWKGDGVSAISAISAGGTQDATLGDVRQRMTAVTPVDLESFGFVQVETTLLGVDGEVLDARSETSSVLPGGAVSTFAEVTARETGAGNAKLVTWTNTQGEDAVLDVQITDAATGELVLSATGDTPVYTERSYTKTEPVLFDLGESPANYIYLVLIDLIDSNGDPFGQQMEVELTVPEAIEGGVGTAYIPFGDGLGAVSLVADGDGYRYHMVLQGSENGDVAGANLIFEEPYEGPAPLDTEVRVDFESQLDKWVQKGDTTWPDNWVVATTLTTPEGAPLGSTTAAGSKATASAPPFKEEIVTNAKVKKFFSKK